MRRDEATMIVGHLVAATTGWNDEAVVAYVAEIERLDHVRVAAEAAQEIVRTWVDARRPPIAVFLNHYRRILDKTEMARQLPAASRSVPFDHGVEIARAAYEHECRARGRQPDSEKFDRWITASRR